MLNHERLADHLDFDRHGDAFLRGRSAAGDVVRRTAAPVFGLRQSEKPSRNIDLLNRSIDDVAVG